MDHAISGRHNRTVKLVRRLEEAHMKELEESEALQTAFIFDEETSFGEDIIYDENTFGKM